MKIWEFNIKVYLIMWFNIKKKYNEPSSMRHGIWNITIGTETGEIKNVPKEMKKELELQ